MGQGTTVYVGNLPDKCQDRELEDLFSNYGRINHVKIRGDPSRGAQFAFVEFDDMRDAEDAVSARNNYELNGSTLRVEISKGGSRSSRGRDSFGSFRSDGSRPSPGNFGRNSGYKVEISNLPEDASWQDLRSNFDGAGKILFANVDRRGKGFVDFAYEEDAKKFVSKMDDTKFTSRNGNTAYIRLKEGGGRGRSCSRSPPRRSSARNNRSRSRSPPRRSPARNNRSRSRSPPRRRSPVRNNRSPGRLTRSPIEEFERNRNARRSASPSNVWARSPSPNRGRSRSPRRSVSPSGDFRKRSRSPKASKNRRRSADSRSPPPYKKARSPSDSPRRVRY